MKITFLLFVVIICASLTLGANSQALAQQTSPESAQNRENLQKEGKLSNGRQTSGSVGERNRARSAATSTRVRPKQLPNNHEHSASKTIANPHPSGSHNSARVAKNGAKPTGTIETTRRFPATSVVRSSVRHRGANPAVIRGTVKSSTRNTAAINGTSMHRRP
jgi:hypothetical protein